MEPEIFRLPPTPGDDDSIFFRGPIGCRPFASGLCPRPPEPAGMDVPSVPLVRAKLRGAPARCCGFGNVFAALGYTPEWPYKSGPTTHTPIIIIIIIIISRNRGPNRKIRSLASLTPIKNHCYLDSDFFICGRTTHFFKLCDLPRPKSVLFA